MKILFENSHFQQVSKKVASYLWPLSKIRSCLSLSIDFFSTKLILNLILNIVLLYGLIHHIITKTKSIDYKDAPVNLFCLKNIMDFKKLYHVF